MSESRRGIINGAETATSVPCDPRKKPKNYKTRSKHPHREPRSKSAEESEDPGVQ